MPVLPQKSKPERYDAESAQPVTTDPCPAPKVFVKDFHCFFPRMPRRMETPRRIAMPMDDVTAIVTVISGIGRNCEFIRPTSL